MNRDGIILSESDLVSPKRDNNLYRVANNNQIKICYKKLWKPSIVIPAYDKLHQISTLNFLWDSPWMYLQDELEVIVIGFSMRPDDYHSRAFIYPQLVRGSQKGNLKVKVIDFATHEKEQKKIKKRYEGVKNCKFWFDGFNEQAWEFIEKG